MPCIWRTGLPRASILTIHPVWDRISGYFPLLLWARCPRSLQGFSYLYSHLAQDLRDGRHFHFSKAPRIQAQVLRFTEQVLFPSEHLSALSPLPVHLKLTTQILLIFSQIFLCSDSQHLPTSSISKVVRMEKSRQVCWHTLLIPTLCQPGLHRKTMP